MLIPKFVSDVPTTLELLLPVMLPDPSMFSQGGQSISDGGHQETWVMRRDWLLYVTVRVLEQENANFQAFLAEQHDRGGLGQFNFFPDKTAGTYYRVWLHKPGAGEELRGRRDNAYPGCLQYDLVLRSANATPLNLQTQPVV